eukprot:3840757-Pleurochrysis_carterae.AAC.2
MKTIVHASETHPAAAVVGACVLHLVILGLHRLVRNLIARVEVLELAALANGEEVSLVECLQVQHADTALLSTELRQVIFKPSPHDLVGSVLLAAPDQHARNTD